MLVIGEHNWQDHVDVVVEGEVKGRGAIPRDYTQYPHCYSSASVPLADTGLKIIPRSEYAERIKDKDANKSWLSDIRRAAGPNGGHIPSLDQDGVGYCWNHSVTMTIILLRAAMNQPYIRLSAFMVGCLIKSYRDEGGWSPLALDFIVKNGIPSVEFWPEKSMSRSNDNEAMRKNALLHKVIDSWVDLTPPIYDRSLTDDEACTLTLTNNPFAGDFNWWSHSVCMGLKLVNGVSQWGTTRSDTGKLPGLQEFDLVWGMNDPVTQGIGKGGINSWTDSYGDKGEFTLTGSKAILDGGCAPRIVNPVAI